MSAWFNDPNSSLALDRAAQIHAACQLLGDQATLVNIEDETGIEKQTVELTIRWIKNYMPGWAVKAEHRGPYPRVYEISDEWDEVKKTIEQTMADVRTRTVTNLNNAMSTIEGADPTDPAGAMLALMKMQVETTFATYDAHLAAMAAIPTTTP